jgi:flagellar protein FliO/FliZ
MGLVQILSMLAALAVTLGLFGLAVWAFRRYVPEGVIPLAPPRAARRLAIVESLMLDTQRRLVLVRLDDQERLILLGEGRLLSSVSTVKEQS